MNLYQWLCILGFPTILATLCGVCWRSISKVKADNNAIKLGVQALLRSNMIKDWNKYSELGYAPLYARENFENCWKQYHTLGANGVMDDIHEKFFKLPTGDENHEA